MRYKEETLSKNLNVPQLYVLASRNILKSFLDLDSKNKREMMYVLSITSTTSVIFLNSNLNQCLKSTIPRFFSC